MQLNYGILIANALVTESVETDFVVKDSDNKIFLRTHTEITERSTIVEKSQLNKLKALSNDNYIEYDLHTNRTGIKRSVIWL